MSKSLYSKGFYAQNIKSSTPSSHAILGKLFPHYLPKSVVDFGCGSGAWLAGAEALGASELRGFDGPWVDPRELTSPNIDFSPINFENEFPNITKKYDLAISVEVAEHIGESRTEDFINLVASASDVVIFSAAIPYQGGTHHVNEQPQSYWIKLFSDAGFEHYDIFRAAIWNNENVRWWFRQNIFLMVHRESNAIDRNVLRSLEAPLVDVVHPANFQRKVLLFRKRIKELEVENQKLKDEIGAPGGSANTGRNPSTINAMFARGKNDAKRLCKYCLRIFRKIQLEFRRNSHRS